MRERLSVRSEYSYEYRIFACEHRTCTRQTSYKLAGREKVKKKLQKIRKTGLIPTIYPSKYFIIHEKQIDLEGERKGKRILEQQIRTKKTQTPWTVNRNHPSRRESR